MTKLTQFGAAGLVDDEFAMSPQERIRHSLQNPTARGALTPFQSKQLAQARMQDTLNALIENNMEKLQGALDAVFTNSPKAGVELFLSLMEFAVPKKKAVEVQMEAPPTSGADLRTYTSAQLEAIAASVVSQQ
jgi:hypothetical protein